jgi:hypothetical protein
MVEVGIALCQLKSIIDLNNLVRLPFLRHLENEIKHT